MKIFSTVLDLIQRLIDKYGTPPETRGEETEKVLKLKKEYEEATKNGEKSD